MCLTFWKSLCPEPPVKASLDEEDSNLFQSNPQGDTNDKIPLSHQELCKIRIMFILHVYGWK